VLKLATHSLRQRPFLSVLGRILYSDSVVQSCTCRHQHIVVCLGRRTRLDDSRWLLHRVSAGSQVCKRTRCGRTTFRDCVRSDLGYHQPSAQRSITRGEPYIGRAGVKHRTTNNYRSSRCASSPRQLWTGRSSIAAAVSSCTHCEAWSKVTLRLLCCRCREDDTEQTAWRGDSAPSTPLQHNGDGSPLVPRPVCTNSLTRTNSLTLASPISDSRILPRWCKDCIRQAAGRWWAQT
jgi:hypothetical protein